MRKNRPTYGEYRSLRALMALRSLLGALDVGARAVLASTALII